METAGILLELFALVEHEIMLFALAGLLAGGLDDFAMDVMFLVRQAKRELLVYTRHAKMTGATLPPSACPGSIAVFIPAWQEANVIGAMLRGCVGRWHSRSFVLFVGAYPNDPDTIHAVAGVANEDQRIRLVVLPHPGGTTKADCLNHIWAAMLREEQAGIM